ncbi:MAG: isochorismatase family protein [Azoarcus sp.]|jgi:nicotinamidase-related amidase|nr:isochorismatase family protein [Azoarcus sp.]
MTRKARHLLIIDPQNDFCDLPASECDGNVPALPVAGADADMKRLADLIEQGGAGIAAITVTLDSHQRLDIGHPGFWRTGDGGAVAPYTQIRAADVKAGTYRPRDAAATQRVTRYLDALEINGRYVHMVWPVHCELGSWGHNVHAAVRRAYNRWEEATGVCVEKVLKGMNPWTEHYSAVRAEVPDPTSSDTSTNDGLLKRLALSDEILIAGEASSHCVKATTEHIVQFRAELARRIVLVADCMSPVAGFESAQNSFIDAMRAKGVRVASSAEILSGLTSAG